ncbi:type IV toxin-antitoxin system YeeU family antitoxin, partial [Escherichia coli]
ITLYAKGLTCEADTLGSCSFVYMAVYATRFSNQLPKASVHQLTHYF